MANKYNWVDDPCISGKSPCDTDVLNENLMHIKYDVTDEIQKKADDAINEVVNAVAVQRIYDCGISTDTKGFEIVKELAHSTFDKSKFEVVGSPTITNDGILNTNNINNTGVKLSSTITQLLETANNWIIETPTIFLENLSTSMEPLIATDITYRGINIGLRSSGIVFYAYPSTSTGEQKIINAVDLSQSILEIGHIYKFRIKYDNTSGYELLYSKDGNNFISIYQNSTVEKIGYSSALLTSGFLGPNNWKLSNNIDLKSFAIWADGIPVFNGNKTGLYVAKPDNYEIVGSPTITEDGIASVFSNNDYIKSNYEFDLTKSWETRITFRTPNSNLQYDSGIGQFEGNLNNNSLSIRADYKLYANFNTGVNLRLISNVIMEKNTKYTAVIGWDLRNYYLEILDHTCKLIDTIKLENNAPLAISDSKRKYRIGKIFDFADGRYKFQGSIDLNAFKIYVDGSLVYQPCLKIPYTEAFEHSKIVDVAYRNRVQDLYEQTGEALFYTLDEQNQNFTVPSGDIYGMITKNREILDIVYPIGRPMPEENNVLLDNEVWLEGATVNIVDYPKLFKVYGTKYGGNGTTTFKLPDLRNRVLWGSSDGSNGYIESKLPNIKGGSVLHSQYADGALNGCFYTTRSTISGNAQFPSNGRTYATYGAGINANLSNEIYSDDATTVQPPAFKVRWKTRFE